MQSPTERQRTIPYAERHTEFMPGISWCQVSPAVRIGLLDCKPAYDLSMPVDAAKHVWLALMLDCSGHYQLGRRGSLCPYVPGYCYLSCGWERFTGTDFFPANRRLRAVLLQYRIEWLEMFNPLMHEGHAGCKLFVHPGSDARILRMPMSTTLLQIAEELLTDGVPHQPVQRLKVKGQALMALWHVAHYLTRGLQDLKLDPRVDVKSSIRTSQVTMRERRLLFAARSYIQAHYLERIDLDSVARAVGLSRAALKQGFRALFGMGVYGYVLECRLDHSVKLLDESTLTVQDIASKCGFAHASHLARLFRQRYHVSPRVYRYRGERE